MRGLDSSCMSYVDTTLIKNRTRNISKKKRKKKDGRQKKMAWTFEPIKNSVVIKTDICTPWDK